MKRACLKCGQLADNASYCAKHRPSRTGRPRPWRNGWQATAWRNRVLAQTGGRCAVHDCPTPTDRVEAHHVHPIGEGGDPHGPGTPLCRHHHQHATRRSA